MKKANTIFKQINGEILPFNLDFDDFYTNIKSPTEQKLEAFINPCLEKIKNIENPQKSYIVLELGFGLGINFFLFANKCLNMPNINFYYVAYEKFYHDIDFLKKSHKMFNLKSPVFNTFAKFYPPQKEGIYRIKYKNITLDLIFGEQSLKNSYFLADFIFLDGFKSSTNKDFYTDIFWKNLKPFLQKNTTIFSYASNTTLKKSLMENDFEINTTKSKHKREILTAIYKNDKEKNQIDGFLLSNLQKNNQKKSIAIIGSGIAAAVTAYVLKEYNDEVFIYEKNEINSGASANKIGLLSALLLKNTSHMQKYYEYIYLNASRFYQNEFGIRLDGCFEYAFDDEKIKRFNENKNNILFQIKNNEAFIKNGGMLRPNILVPKILQKSKAIIKTNHELISYEKIDNKIRLDFKNQTSAFCDILIFCTGSGSKKLFPDLPLSINQGQVSLVRNFLKTKGYSTKSYVTPPLNNIQIIGATYDRINDDSTILSEEKIQQNHKQNIENFLNFYPHKINEKPKIFSHKIGNRLYSSDRFIISGAYLPKDDFNTLYKDLFFTKHKPQSFLPQSNIYLNIAHGSRGLGSAIMGANIITSYIYGVPSAYPLSILKQCSPCRFYARNLKSGRG